MKILYLKRVVQSNVTLGALTDGEAILALTLENPWLQNKAMASCIPEGDYNCEIVKSPKYGEVYEVQEVPNRSHILIHWGNYVKDTDGCILLGSGVADIDGDGVQDITQSKIAFDKFMAKLAGKPFILKIRWV